MNQLNLRARLRQLLRWLPPVAVVVVVLGGCTPVATRDLGPTTDSAQPGQARTLIMAVRYEVTDLAPKIPGGGSPVVTKRLFNAAPALIDGVGSPRPYLAEVLPELNTGAWRVFPDGRMETTYRLRPGLTWHDGRSLTADDFVFAWRVYTHPALSVFNPSPQNLIETMAAPDPRTVVITWRSLYPDAGALKQEDLDPLPAHVLQGPFAVLEQDATAADAFLNHPFWTHEYVGAGPFRLERWEPGSQFDGVAFDGHALGRPKIDRIVVRIVADENTTLTNVLAGNVHFTADFTLRFEHAQVLKRDWASANRGSVVLKRSSPVSQTAQLRPDLVGDPRLLDVRVRRALAQSLDRAAVNDGVFEGEGFMSESAVPPDVPYFPEVDRTLAKYPYDLRRTEGLMGEAGLARDRDGFYASAAGERFKLDFRTFSGPEFERVQTILTDSWRRAGIDVQASILPAAQVRDRQTAHSFPGLATRGGGLNEQTWTSGQIATAANRWTGENRAGWSNPEYDRLWEAFTTTLDRSERTRQFMQMQKLVSEHLPTFITYFAVQVNTQVAGLRGPEPGTTGTGTTSGTFTPGTLAHWNVHEWELR